METRLALQSDWISLGLIAGLICLALFRVAAPARFNDVLASAISERIFSQELYPQQALNAYNAIFQLFFLCMLGLLLYQVQPWELLGMEQITFPLILGALFVLTAARLFIDNLLGYALNLSQIVDFYYSRRFTYLAVVGIGLLVLNVILHFIQWNGAILGYVFLLIAVLLVVLSLGYAYLNISQFVAVQPFYFFLYICTLEIAPLLLLHNALAG